MYIVKKKTVLVAFAKHTFKTLAKYEQLSSINRNIQKSDFNLIMFQYIFTLLFLYYI